MKTKNFFLITTLLLAGITLGAQTIMDAEGNNYKTVKIGEEVWMAENLKSTNYNDGTPIPLVADETAWRDLTTPGYCWYKNNQESYGGTYGVLYNWFTVSTGILCPKGWHVPGNSEWIVLTKYLGGDYIAGGKLKEAGTAHWKNPNISATNESGFTALPAGRRNGGGIFSGIGTNGHWWTSTETKNNQAWYRGLGNPDISIDSYRYNKRCGFSVRCLKD